MLGMALFFAATLGNAANIYKYRLPDGTVLYTQKALKDHKPIKVINEPPPSARQLQRQRAAQRQLVELRARSERLGEERRAREAAEEQQRLALLDAERADAALRLSLVPGPGDRLSTAFGGSRLSDEYWERVRTMLEEEYAARSQLERAAPY